MFNVLDALAVSSTTAQAVKHRPRVHIPTVKNQILSPAWFGSRSAPAPVNRARARTGTPARFHVGPEIIVPLVSLR